MAKKVQHFTIDPKTKTIQIHSAKYLTDEEKAQVKLLAEIDGYTLEIKPLETTKQKEHRDKNAKQDKYYYLGGGADKKEAVIKSKADQDYFKAICAYPSKSGGGFFKAKSWWENRDMLANENGAESWDKATKTQKDKTVEWFYTVSIKKGKIVAR